MSSQIIRIQNLPMPPTSNHQYILVRRGGKTFHVASEALKQFRRDFKQRLGFNVQFTAALFELKTWGAKAYRVECELIFTQSKLYTKKGTVKKLDTSNRLKALHDALSEALGIDDSLFFYITAEKRVGLGESVNVNISPYL